MASNNVTSGKVTALRPQPSTDPRHQNRWGQLYGSSSTLAIVETARAESRLAIVITPDTPTAMQIEQECRFFGAGSDQLPLLQFPDWETLPYDSFSPHQDIISQRLLALHLLPGLTKGILIVPVATLMQRLPPTAFLDGNFFRYRVGDRLDLHGLRERLISAGYHSVSEVMEHGEFCVRGSLLDLFPMGGELPFRIELLDDEIESIRSFDPDNQRTISKVENIDLLPAREFPLNESGITQFRRAYRAVFEGDPQASSVYRDVSKGLAPAGVEYYLPLFYEQTATLFDYVPPACLLFAIDGIHAAAERYWLDVTERHEMFRHDLSRPILPPTTLFIHVPELFSNLNRFPLTAVQSFEIQEQAGAINYETRLPPLLTIDAKALEPAARLTSFVTAFNGRILFVAESTGRRESLLQLLQRQQISPTIVNGWAEFVNSDLKHAITVSPSERGLLLDTPSLCVICEQQLFGEQVLQQRRRRSKYREPDQIIKNLVELEEGSPVVHEEHGIGRYRGLRKITVSDIEQEYLTIEYAGEDKLYVPVSSLHMISRYTGVSPENAPWHKLGSSHWEKVKRKARERVNDVAVQLLDIYARREARSRLEYQIDEAQYRGFAASFPFEETPDQEEAIRAVLQDMRSAKPMDRLICGDVGFGKTEVAMRAAFIAVLGGKQVAMLVPTTLLAQQHFDNFQDRFADWPVRIESLSRFKSKKELSASEQALRDGKIDIIIGTHKLLQSGIKYQRLGLVIIDEEHRFGVRQKELFKSIRSEVDVLTMTATPIPRTLNMSFSGLRDLSIIATPPARRLTIKTFVSPWNQNTVREACLREIRRGGQIFYLHNKVDDIDKVAADLRELVPQASVEIAHGQMRERQLERVMADFYHQRFNLLVCTTIIETGIDVPNANTIIIDRADKFGLAQLYQLRGRVGRSHHQAYAYLIVPDRKLMTADAVKRLEAIESIEELGTGFTLATHDLEIRGAGEILGDEQSGQMHEIGFSLYIDMLERAVSDIKAGKTPELDKPLHTGTEIDLGVSVIIPDDYLPDVHTRLIMYKRIANAANNDALRELQVEMIDRFGLLPPSTKNLFVLTEIKLFIEPIGIKKITFGATEGTLQFTPEPAIEPFKLIQLIQKKPNCYRFDGKSKLSISRPMPTLEARAEEIYCIVRSIIPDIH